MDEEVYGFGEVEVVFCFGFCCWVVCFGGVGWDGGAADVVWGEGFVAKLCEEEESYDRRVWVVLVGVFWRIFSTHVEVESFHDADCNYINVSTSVLSRCRYYIQDKLQMLVQNKLLVVNSAPIYLNSPILRIEKG